MKLYSILFLATVVVNSLNASQFIDSKYFRANVGYPDGDKIRYAVYVRKLCKFNTVTWYRGEQIFLPMDGSYDKPSSPNPIAVSLGREDELIPFDPEHPNESLRK